MADKIDKALPNEPRKSINVPGEEEIQEQVVEAQEEIEEGPDGVEVTEQEDWYIPYKFIRDIQFYAHFSRF